MTYATFRVIGIGARLRSAGIRNHHIPTTAAAGFYGDWDAFTES